MPSPIIEWDSHTIPWDLLVFCIIHFLQPTSDFIFFFIKHGKWYFLKSKYTFNHHLRLYNSETSFFPNIIHKRHDIMGQSHDITRLISFYDIQCSHNIMRSRAQFFFYFKYWQKSSDFDDIIWTLVMKLEKSDLNRINMSKSHDILKKLQQINNIMLLLKNCT